MWWENAPILIVMIYLGSVALAFGVFSGIKIATMLYGPIRTASNTRTDVELKLPDAPLRVVIT